jgi:hypothetical protein
MSKNSFIGIVEIERQRVIPRNRIGSIHLELLAGNITKEEASKQVERVLTQQVRR